jgi:hypothetical protein
MAALSDLPETAAEGEMVEVVVVGGARRRADAADGTDAPCFCAYFFDIVLRVPKQACSAISRPTKGPHKCGIKR